MRRGAGSLEGTPVDLGGGPFSIDDSARLAWHRMGRGVEWGPASLRAHPCSRRQVRRDRRTPCYSDGWQLNSPGPRSVPPRPDLRGHGSGLAGHRGPGAAGLRASRLHALDYPAPEGGAPAHGRGAHGDAVGRGVGAGGGCGASLAPAGAGPAEAMAGGGAHAMGDSAGDGLSGGQPPLHPLLGLLAREPMGKDSGGRWVRPLHRSLLRAAVSRGGPPI